MTKAKKVLELVNGVRVSVNPRSLSQALIDLRLSPDFLSAGITPGTGVLRVLADLDTKNIYVWNAGEELHKEMAWLLGVDNFASGIGRADGCNLDDPKNLEERKESLYACQDKIRSLFGHLKS